MDIFVFEYFTAAYRGDTGLAAEGRAMRDALVRDLEAIPSIRTLTLEADDLPSTTDDALDEAFAHRCARAKLVCVIAPEERALLAKYTRQARRLGCRLLNASASVIAWASDKNRTAHILRSLGVPHPPMANPRDPENCVVVKPIDGAGGVGVTVWDPTTPSSERQIDPIRMRFERFCGGMPGSISIMGHPRSPTLLPPVRQHFLPGSFRYSHGTLLDDPPLIARASALVTPLLPLLSDSRGWIGIDLVLGDRDDGSKDFVIEVNPRLTSSYLTLRGQSDQNLARLLLDGVTADQGQVMGL